MLRFTLFYTFEKKFHSHKCEFSKIKSNIFVLPPDTVSYKCVKKDRTQERSREKKVNHKIANQTCFDSIPHPSLKTTEI